MELQVVSQPPGFANMSAAYDALAGAVGGASFNATLVAAIRKVALLDRLYLFNFAGPKAIHLQIAEYETVHPPTQHDVYVSDYMPVDPILGAIRRAVEPGHLVLLRVGPQDIQQLRYRQALKSADIVERVSIVRRDSGQWQCLNVARGRAKGPFAHDELVHLANFARLVLPLTSRHSELVQSMPVRLTVTDLERRFAALNLGLTSREIEVCARAAFGLTVEGTALDLNIGRASVLTYRKRAYARLSVTSVNELCKLVMT